MKRALPVAALLVAVLAVGLCLAQPSPTTGAAPGEKPKEEPKYYARFSMGVVLREDSMEASAQKALDAALASVGFDVGHPSWLASTVSNPRPKAPHKPLTDRQRTSYYVVYSPAITLGQMSKVAEALAPFANNAMCEKGTLEIRLSTAPFFPNREPIQKAP